jgi:hypothetical protein
MISNYGDSKRFIANVGLGLLWSACTSKYYDEFMSKDFLGIFFLNGDVNIFFMSYDVRSTILIDLLSGFALDFSSSYLESQIRLKFYS